MKCVLQGLALSIMRVAPILAERPPFAMGVHRQGEMPESDFFSSTTIFRSSDYYCPCCF
jgi:hypothetical protein